MPTLPVPYLLWLAVLRSPCHAAFKCAEVCAWRQTRRQYRDPSGRRGGKLRGLGLVSDLYGGGNLRCFLGW